jgi:type I restriction enzyme M protein
MILHREATALITSDSFDMLHAWLSAPLLQKSDLYSSLWASCDELRGGMDASQYKDYVLFMLFIKYITDKYGSSTDFAPSVTAGAALRHFHGIVRQRAVGGQPGT